MKTIISKNWNQLQCVENYRCVEIPYWMCAAVNWNRCDWVALCWQHCAPFQNGAPLQSNNITNPKEVSLSRKNNFVSCTTEKITVQSLARRSIFIFIYPHFACNTKQKSKRHQSQQQHSFKQYVNTECGILIMKIT